MEEATNTQHLKVKVTNKQILSLALPITFAMLVPQINMLTNNIFLGALGTEHLGNAGITGVFYLIFAVAGQGLNIGAQTVFAKHAGAGKPEDFKTILAQGLRFSLIMAITFILFTYFASPFILSHFAEAKSAEAEEDFMKIRVLGLPFLYLFQLCNGFLVASLNTRYLMYGFVFEAAVNILFDYLLIFGNFGFPKLGFNGAAWASVIAEVSGCLLVLAVLAKTGLKKKYGLFSTLAHNGQKLKEVFQISIPLIFQFVISVTTWLFFFFLIEEKGTEAKAVSNTMRNVFGLSGVFIWAFGSTATTMVSNLIGQNQNHKVVPALWKIAMWSVAFSSVVVLLLNVFPAAFFKMFGQSGHFVTEATPVLHVVSIGILIMAFGNIWLNGVTGTGQTKVNLGIEIFAIICYTAYTWYFMKLHYINLQMAWSNELVYWFMMFICSFLFIVTGRWKRKFEKGIMNER